MINKIKLNPISILNSRPTIAELLAKDIFCNMCGKRSTSKEMAEFILRKQGVCKDCYGAEVMSGCVINAMEVDCDY